MMSRRFRGNRSRTNREDCYFVVEVHPELFELLADEASRTGTTPEDLLLSIVSIEVGYLADCQGKAVTA